MTTVVDPNGTPVPIYNRSGATIVEVSAGLTPVPITVPIVKEPIPSNSQHTIVLVTSDGGSYQNSVSLPENCDVGDRVEIYAKNYTGASLLVYAPDGEDLVGGYTDETGYISVALQFIGASVFLKTGATEWRCQSSGF